MEVIVRDRDIPGGPPVFRGTRGLVQVLFDYLEGGEPLEDPKSVNFRELSEKDGRFHVEAG